jgi:hypothetical protein
MDKYKIIQNALTTKSSSSSIDVLKVVYMPKFPLIKFLFSTLVCVSAVGCVASKGEFRQTTGTQVALDSNNYKVVKAGVRGESTGFKILGIISLAAPSYADAKAALYQNTGENLTGRSIALANQTEDSSGINLLIFQIPKVTITADVVEFNDKSNKGK